MRMMVRMRVIGVRMTVRMMVRVRVMVMVTNRL
jgi:hypothetical protein